jgi:HD-GYP domain-containing protein (c-di-GMP phosphodiesterase class II)
MGLADDNCRMLRAAGHWHDLGKLSVPSEILENPRPLTPAEINRIKVHPYHTFQVLRGIDKFHEVNMWSSYHHECLDGSGYPFHLTAGDLTTEARIVALADVFCALSEDRPYRPTMPRTEVIRILDESAKNFKLDRDVVGVVTENFDDFNALLRSVQSRVVADYDRFANSMLFPALR